jgi:cobalt-zinc-cadmium efflux system protein
MSLHHHHHDHARDQAGDPSATGPGRAPETAEAAARARERGLRTAILLTFGFAIVEAIGGWWSGSLALMADAGHMVTDSSALLLAWIAARLSQRPASPRLSYGWRRAEVLAALANALFMIAVVALLVPAAIERLRHPTPVMGGSVMLIAAAGLVINLFVYRALHDADRGALNIRGALIHVLGDLLGSVAALIAGAVIWATGWTPIDPLLTLLIAALIAYSSVQLIGDVLGVLMEAVPRGIDLAQIERELRSHAGVEAVHDLHVWTLAGDRLLLSAHLEIADGEAWPELLVSLQEHLRDRHRIFHATLQAEPPAYRQLMAQAARGHDDHAH